MENAKIAKIVQNLAENAGKIKEKVKEGDLSELSKLVGERVALIEALRSESTSKVSSMDSDSRIKMESLIKKMECDVSEAIGSINSNLSSLTKALRNLRGEKNIAAYKVQGGRYGY